MKFMDCEGFEHVQLEALLGDASLARRREAAHHARTCEPCRRCAQQDRFLEATFRADGETAFDDFDETSLKATFEERRATCCRVEAPFGPVFLARTAQGICRVSFRSRSEGDFLRDLEARDLLPAFDPGKLGREAGELEDYFSGRRKTFQAPIDLRFVTPFQERVLRATARIPFGSVSSYGEIARQIGKPEARRAVGGALGHNPIPIIIPCHRVIAADGSIGGYTGGLKIKRELFKIEGISLKEEEQP
jgi:methylated-DNA-[protein]-cysteine S-methyltransferase